MIDTEKEKLILIRDVPGLLPKSPRTGRAFTTNAVYSWIGAGSGGHRLEVVKVGGCLYTSSKAVTRFIRELSEQHARGAGEVVPA